MFLIGIFSVYFNFISEKIKKKTSPGWREAIRGQVIKKTLNAVAVAFWVVSQLDCHYQPLLVLPLFFKHISLTLSSMAQVTCDLAFMNAYSSKIS
jgi:hypothetical protein